MAATPYSALKGQGYLYPVQMDSSGPFSTKTWSIGPPTCSGSAYLTFEAVRLPNGSYDNTSSTPGLATFSGGGGLSLNTLITSSYIFSVIIPPGNSSVSFEYTPTNTILANTVYIRATGGIWINSI
tara:strand:- start:369 stop:746 length:378 start_codon:yes stop_codon:yes gene_type:complete